MMGASRVRTPLNWRRIAVRWWKRHRCGRSVVVSGYLAVQHLRYYNVTAYFTSTDPVCMSVTTFVSWESTSAASPRSPHREIECASN